VADQLESESSLRRQIKSAMVYPTVVLSVASIVLIALVTFVIPVFVNVFKQFPNANGSTTLPEVTQISIDVSKLFTTWYYIAAPALAIVLLAFVKWKSSKNGRRQWNRICLRVPMKIGDIVQKVAVARWSRTLSALSGAGVPLLQALEVTGKTAGNVVVDEAMQSVIESVKQGGTLAEPLKKEPIFPGMVVQMVAVGEETGALDQMLSRIADFYEDQVDAAVKALTSILEPVMIVFIGGMVGFVVISMYMPLFQLYNNIQ